MVRDLPYPQTKMHEDVEVSEYADWRRLRLCGDALRYPLLRLEPQASGAREDWRVCAVA